MFNTINYLTGRRVSSVVPPRKKSSSSNVNTKIRANSYSTNDDNQPDDLLQDETTRTDYSDHSSSSHSDDIDDISRLAYPSRSFRRKNNKERAVALMGHVKQQKQIRKMFQGETTTAMMKLPSNNNNTV